MASGDAPASSSSPPPPPTTAPEAAAASSPTTSETNHHDPDNDDNDPTTTAAASFRLGVSPALRRLDGFVPTTHSSSSTAADPDPADVDGTAPGARRAQRETDDAEQARRRYLERMDPEAAAPAAASHTRDTAVSIEMLEMRLRRARARHTRRLVTLRVRYDQGKKYLDDTFPEELEGIVKCHPPSSATLHHTHPHNLTVKILPRSPTPSTTLASPPSTPRSPASAASATPHRAPASSSPLPPSPSPPSSSASALVASCPQSSSPSSSSSTFSSSSVSSQAGSPHRRPVRSM
ncbi:hypothetical protein DFJ73DRAFT_886704, partial [Zopfochytrium polystomum]